jgi:hypothetical protein
MSKNVKYSRQWGMGIRAFSELSGQCFFNHLIINIVEHFDRNRIDLVFFKHIFNIIKIIVEHSSVSIDNVLPDCSEPASRGEIPFKHHINGEGIVIDIFPPVLCTGTPNLI